MCSGESLLVLYYFLGLFLHFFIPYHVLSFYMCDSRKIVMFEVRKEGCTYVKKNERIFS
jgi:hypothetical protein